MARIARLLTFVDVDYEDFSLGEPLGSASGWTAIRSRRRRPDPRRMSVTARHEAVLADGRRVVLLNDRGWGGGAWASGTVEEIERTARVVVGPDEQFAERTQDDMDAEHWAWLAQILERQGVAAEPAELKALPHDVEFSDRLIARISGGAGTPPRA